MPDREEFFERLQAQLQELITFIMAEVMAGNTTPLTKRPPDRSAAPFCNSLAACKTDEEGKSCVKSDIQGARACVNVAETAIARIKTRAFQFLPRRPEQQTRFFFLTSVVTEYLDSEKQTT
jgi:hypothetical protein